IPTARLMADTLAGMEIERAFVIHGEPGWDEATPCGPFTQFDVRGGAVTESWRDPADFGIERCTPADLTGGDAIFNARALEAVLVGDDRGAHRDALVLGAALVLELTGRTPGLREGIELANAAIDDGSARNVLEKLRAFGAAT
ncbi:MAG: anthranilate phosphoribosyltransferase, partial [Gammaproteobacteria bacterium]|nr:anthranilate phosphoribosyltransferase [Gammaproteobacteria bacterium]